MKNNLYRDKKKTSARSVCNRGVIKHLLNHGNFYKVKLTAYSLK